MNRTIKVFIGMIILFGCGHDERYLDRHREFNTEDVTEIVIKSPALCDSEKFDDIVVEKDVIPQMLHSINYAKIVGPCKGACWFEIEIIENNRTTMLFTDGRVIGTKSNGWFYDLKNEIILDEITKGKVMNGLN